jgi:bifunctional DNase/RNase
MDKIKLDIAGLSYSQTQSGAYALVLNESGGKRQLPIIIGGFEAQSIAIELEKMTPTRPLTHDLFKSFAIAFSIQVNEVIIYKLLEGIFYAKLVCEKDGFVTEIDARTSDAIAVGVRFNCPIYTFESILSGAGTLLTEGLDEVLDEQSTRSDTEGPISTLASHSIEELEEKLEEALDNEDYELASRIRDELNRRK